MTSYNAECIYVKCLAVTSITGGTTSVLVGSPTPPNTFSHLVNIQPTDVLADGLWKLEQKLLLLFPPLPPFLSTITLSLQDPTYPAYRSDGQVISMINTIVQNNALGKPRTQTTIPFYDADSGTIAAFVKSNAGLEAVRGFATLSTADDSGTYGDLIIESDADTSTPAGFYKTLTAHIGAYTYTLAPSSTTEYTFRLAHSITGITPLLTFYQDDAMTPTVINQYIIGISGTTTYVSGVPSVDSGSLIRVTFTVLNAVRTHYHIHDVGSIGGTYVQGMYALPSVLYRTPGSSPVFTFDAVPLTSRYTENVVIACFGKSSNGATGVGAATHPLGPVRMDTMSIARNEQTLRVTSGLNDYPINGTYNSGFNSATSLVGNQELQILAGRFLYPPAVSYLNSLPAGPDYTTVTSEPYRWATFNYGTRSLTLINVDIISGLNLSSVVENYRLQVILRNATKWVNGNAPYPGVGNPGTGSLDGDPALVIASSSLTRKVITFGNIFYTNVTPIIRIGLPVGSTISFDSINATFV